MPSDTLERDRTDVDQRAEERPRRPDESAPVRRPAEAPAADAKSNDKPAAEGKPKPTLLGRLRAHPFIAGTAALILIAAIVAGVFWWLDARQYESTDDAFID